MMSEEQQETGGWHGMGFLRELIKSTEKKTNQVNVLYAREEVDGTIATPQPLLADALMSEQKEPFIWIVRPKWVKVGGKWKTEIPHNADPTRWFRIDVSKASRAFVGNVLAGPKGKGYLSLRKTLRTALRSGDFNAKVRAKMFGVLGTSSIKARTMKDIEKMVGTYIAYLTVEYAAKPALMARHAYRTAGRWAIIDHIANDLRNDGDRKKLVALRDSLAPSILSKDYKGVPDALAAALRFVQADKELSLQMEPLAEIVAEKLGQFIVDIFFKVSPEIQNVFALEGRHRMKAAADRKVLGGTVNKTMTKPATEQKLNALPALNTKRKRAWLKSRTDPRIYTMARQANAMPEDTKVSPIGYRIGGQGGHRSAPATTSDGSITMFLTPLLALQDAARRGETSTVLWIARFSKASVSLHTGTVSGVPKQGFVYLDIGKLIGTYAYQMSQYLYRAAYDMASPELKESLSAISLTFTLAGTAPSYKPKLKELAIRSLIFNPPQPIRDYLRIAMEAANESPIHSAFWPASLVIQHVGSEEFSTELGHLMFGSMLREKLEACTSAKQRQWEMYEWIDSTFHSSVFSFATVEALRAIHQKGIVVTS